MHLPLADEILRRLLQAGGRPVSGQGLAAGLGVTRAAVWKGVESLRACGYPVESLPALGYRLNRSIREVRPGEVAAHLKTNRLGRSLRHFASVDSTNRAAERWALEGAEEGALVVADHQDEGRGRMGRTWFDRPGKSLLFSLILRPPIAAANAPAITFAAAVALAETLARRVPREHLEIKWPNDLLISGRKAAGILLEMRCEAQQVEHVILGVGVNVEGTSDDFPVGVSESCTTLEETTAGPPDRLGVLCAFLEIFEPLYDEFVRDGFGPLQQRWNEWFRMTGRWLRVRTPAGTVEGLARGLGPGGTLILDSGGPTPAVVHAGDVEWSSAKDA